MHFLAEGDDPPVIMIPEPVDNEDADGLLPQVKIKRNYICPHPGPQGGDSRCEYFTQNPRSYLLHLRHTHGERMRIYECPQCTYASRHSQKMHRHVSMVHDPDRPERRRPGPAPRLREEYYADFVNELHKRRHRKAARKRKRAEDRAMARAAPTATVTSATITRPDPPDADASDSDSGDRLVIDNSDEEEHDAPVPEADEEEEEGEDEDDDDEDDGDGDDFRGESFWSPERDGQDIDDLLVPRPRDVRLEQDPVTLQYKCSSCEFTSRTPSLVARHESVVHLKKRFYRCNKCTYVTHLRSRYTKHYKYHTMPLIKCAECDFRTPYKWNLDRHIKNHGGYGKYTCRACSFSTDIRQSLTVHEMNHHHPAVGGEGDERRPHKRRQNRVGATATVTSATATATSATSSQGARPSLRQESEMLRMEWEENEFIQAAAYTSTTVPSPSASGRWPQTDACPSTSAAAAAGCTPSVPSVRSLRCSQCDYRTPNFADMSRHMSGVHNSSKMARSPPTLTPAPAAKRVAKPLPNLIPIQATPLGMPRLAPQPNAHAAPAPSPASSPASSPAVNGDSAAETTKKKNSFFDQLRLYPGNSSDPGTLVCVHCGHEAKCMSELVRHNKLHQGRAMGTSTRCQHCRHRCKTSADLTQHLKTCSKASASAAGVDSDSGPSAAGGEAQLGQLQAEADALLSRKVLTSLMPDDDSTRMTTDSEGTMEGEFGAGEAEYSTDAAAEGDDEDGDCDGPSDDNVPTADPGLVGVETAQGYGLVTTQEEYDERAAKEKVVSTVTNLKKVFKCPHCPFWAATASRFHVHMVGHLNKKPFACSVCKYRSNWRWDITKHIKVKSPRDALHLEAKILMTDETGRRNYTKYNQHLLWLKAIEISVDAMKAVVMNGAETGMNGNQVKTAPVAEVLPVLPAPPKLTRAPAPRIVPQARPSAPGTLLRPPPPLQAAAPQTTRLIILPSGVRVGQGVQQQQPSQSEQQQQNQLQHPLKRPADSPIPNVGSDPKKPNTEIKKTVWRCKQCHFRDGDRHVVLTHVKGHYRQQQDAAIAKLKGSPGATSILKPANSSEQPQAVGKKISLRCDICPFVASSESAMQTHAICHKERDDVFFKCYYCPFYVPSKEELVQHMTVHRQSPKGESNVTVPDKASPVQSKPEAPPQHSPSNKTEPGKTIKVKEELHSELDIPMNDQEDGQLAPPVLDYSNLNEAPLCWVFRDNKLQKMIRCRYCPHVNLRKSNMLEHEKMHMKRASQSLNEAGDTSSQYSPHPCPDCSYLCNNAGVLSSHMKVHLSNYPQVYSLFKAYKNDLLQVKEISEKYKLPLKTFSNQKSSPPKDKKESPVIGNENKLCGINVMKLLDPNQSLTDAVLAMKKKFNLELDGEPFAEPVEDPAESPPCSPLKPLNDGTDPVTSDSPEEKQLHFCPYCPARFLFRKELGIHSRFHNLHLVHKCDNCSYTARQRSHLQAHLKVHTEDYQERTNALLKMYQVHSEFPKPRIVCVAKKGGMPGSTICIVVNDAKPKSVEEPSSSSSSSPKFLCHKCPASFFKLDAMHSHLALHGSNNPHKCCACDYAVKTANNLIKHLRTHGCRASAAKKIVEGMVVDPESLRLNTVESQAVGSTSPANNEREESKSSDSFEEVNSEGTSSNINEVKEDADMESSDKLKLQEEEGEEEEEEKKPIAEDKDKENNPTDPLPTPRSQSTGFAMGSPEFVYPTYCRNGRMKVKRYKCHKCPSAFEKRDQYLIHLSLHGSKQRYPCDRCDYSVKFYANHVQHIRRHQLSDEARASNKDDSNASEGEEFIPEDSENIPSASPPSPTRSAKTTGGKGEKLSVADKQAMMVLQQRRAKGAAVSREALDKNYWCSHCPYSSPRRDQVESHMKRHFLVSGVRNAFVCDHCDYSVPNKHFLRDHSKLHFDVSKAPRPDAYMICDRLELWASSGFMGKNKSKGRVLIFQDKGSNVLSDRFLPPLASEVAGEDNNTERRVCINPKTFEAEGFNDIVSKDNKDSIGEADSNFDDDRESFVKNNDQTTETKDKECVKNDLDSSRLNGVSSENNTVSQLCSAGSVPVENSDVKSN